MMARPITMPAVAPNACTVRATIRPVIEVAASAAKLATTVSASPASITGRRPKRSDSGPSTSCEIAMPSRNSESVSCTVPAPAPSVTIRPGHRRRQDVERQRPDRRRCAISSASSRQGCSSELHGHSVCATGSSCARSGSSTERPCGGFKPGRVSAATSGVSVSATRGVIGVEPGDLVGRHQRRLDQARRRSARASASRRR